MPSRNLDLYWLETFVLMDHHKKLRMTLLVVGTCTSTYTRMTFDYKMTIHLRVPTRRKKIMPQGLGIRLDSYRLGECGRSYATISYIYLGILSNMEDLKGKLNQENFEPDPW